MRILIDIGHPAHVHYFKNFYKIMKMQGNDFLFISRNKEVTFELLKFYAIPYVSRGKGKTNFIGKLLYILYADFIILKNALKFKPDIFISFSSSYMGHVAFLLRKPNIIIDDTEHASLEHIMYKPFADVILTPDCFYKNMGKKQIKFNSFTELFYLHSDYFQKNDFILSKLGVQKGEKYAIVRFVSWGASHDFGQTGFSDSAKINIVESISKHYKVFITSESELPQKLQKYRIKIAPEEFHDAIAFSSLYVGEGATTASETAILGIPTLYINSIPLMGYLKKEQQAGLLFHFTDQHGVKEKAEEIITRLKTTFDFEQNAEKLLEDKINPTKFLTWFVTNYPNSFDTMKQNPEYQYNFK